MAKRPTLTDVTSLTNSSAINTLNQNWDSIQSAFDNTLSLDGSTPNAMNADLDLNGNALINVGTIDVTNLTLDGQTVTDIASVPEWKGAWVTATAYVKNDLVKTNGNVYICLISHTSAAAFSTDLTAVRWELMVTKGDSGVGSGDLVSTNNLSDLADDATARSNLGLGTVATENTVPIAKGGTGATDASTARTNLGLGSLATLSSVTTTQIAAATLVTASETIAANDNDTTIPTCAAVIDLVSANSGRALLATRTASASATLDFTEFNNAVYRRYLFEVEFLLPATDNTDLWMRTSTNGGSSYDSGASDYSWFVHGGTAGAVSVGPGGVETDTKIVVCQTVGNAANEFGVNVDLDLIGAANASVFTVARGQVLMTNASTATWFADVAGFRKSAADVDAVRFLFSSGNITSGTIRMYGIV